MVVYVPFRKYNKEKSYIKKQTLRTIMDFSKPDKKGVNIRF